MGTTIKRSTMLADRPIVWKTVKVSSDAYNAISNARKPYDSMNDAIERAIGIIRGERTRKLASVGKKKLTGFGRKNKKASK